MQGNYQCKICGEIPEVGQAAKHLREKHPAQYGKMDYITDNFTWLNSKNKIGTDKP